MSDVHSGAVAPEFIARTCPAVPLANFDKAVEPEAYSKSPAVNDEMLVPPLATGNVPVTSAVKSTPPALIVTSPEETEKLSDEKLAIPLLEVEASSPAIVNVVPVADVSIPSPPDTVNDSESKSISIVPESDIKSKSCAVTCAST